MGSVRIVLGVAIAVLPTFSGAGSVTAPEEPEGSVGDGVENELSNGAGEPPTDGIENGSGFGPIAALGRFFVLVALDRWRFGSV